MFVAIYTGTNVPPYIIATIYYLYLCIKRRNNDKLSHLVYTLRSSFVSNRLLSAGKAIRTRRVGSHTHMCACGMNIQ